MTQITPGTTAIIQQLIFPQLIPTFLTFYATRKFTASPPPVVSHKNPVHGPLNNFSLQIPYSVSTYSENSVQNPWPSITFRNMFTSREELLELCSTRDVEGQPLSAVRDCYFNTFTATNRLQGQTVK